jgi:hypothetical protein
MSWVGNDLFDTYDGICPFCGNDEPPVIIIDEHHKIARAYCAECDSSGPPVKNRRMKEEELKRTALEQWCRRAASHAGKTDAR